MVAEVLIPDEGTVEVRQGVAPLIEITGGFVDDLSVRDNVYLAAGLHGKSKDEIDDEFDDIIDFAEVKDFVNTPYKHLSSGMKVRVAFSVVSRLDEPILLVDEVLAVGDRGFRQQVLRPHRGDARGGPHPVLRLAQRRRPQALLQARALPRVVTVAPPLADDERGRTAQKRLERAYRRSRPTAEDAVFLESFDRQSASCNPPASTAPSPNGVRATRVYWSVVDGSVAVPDGAVRPSNEGP